MSKPCNHFVTAFIHGQPTLFRADFLVVMIEEYAYENFVSLKRPPLCEHLRWLKEFKKFKHCPKCGEKIDFRTTERELAKESERLLGANYSY